MAKARTLIPQERVNFRWPYQENLLLSAGQGILILVIKHSELISDFSNHPGIHFRVKWKHLFQYR
jgi:hypothetical protein